MERRLFGGLLQNIKAFFIKQSQNSLLQLIKVQNHFFPTKKMMYFVQLLLCSTP